MDMIYNKTISNGKNSFLKYLLKSFGVMDSNGNIIQ